MQTKNFSVLYHIGTLNIEEKYKVHSQSQEGHGLSVSQCPDAWRSIARLGGNPLWRLTRDGNTFLDYHYLSDEEQQVIQNWGLESGWVALKKVWVASYYDDEAECARFFYVDSKEDALNELGCESEEDFDEGQSVEEKTVPGTTQRLNDYIGFKVDDVEVPDMLALAYADHVLHLDGVFWDDYLDPVGLSAPRAVIFPEKLVAWTVKKASDAEWHFTPGDAEDPEDTDD
jgi:hypothetical protein